MMHEWDEVTIDEIKSPQAYSIAMGPFGSNIKTDNFVSSGVPIIRGINLNEGRFNEDNFVFLTEEKANELKSSNAFPGDIVFTHRGTLGQVGLIPKKAKYIRYVVSQSQMKLRCDPQKADPSFVFYFFRSPLGQYALLSNTSTTGVPAISRPLTSLRNIRIPLPPLPEQRAIADVLSSLDDKIELNRCMNATLEDLAQTLFKHWFIDNPEREMWAIGSIGDDFNLTMGQSPPGETYNEQEIGIPFFQGRTDFGFRFPTNRIHCTAPTRFSKTGDTLVSVRAPVGDINIALEDCSIGRGLASIRHKSGSRSYTYYSMNYLKGIFNNFESEGTVFGSINKDAFLLMKVFIPHSEQVEHFEKLCYPLDQKIENNEKETRTLTELRDTLLPRLMSGQVRVKDI